MNKKIGNKLKMLRKQKGWSQEQVAENLSISQSSYARMENGDSHSWANHLVKLCEIFEIEIENLFKQDNFSLNQNHQSCEVCSQLINQLYDKLIESYEEQIKDLKNIIIDLNKQIQTQK